MANPQLLTELLAERNGGALDATLFHQLSGAGQHAVMAVTVAQIQPINDHLKT